MKILTEGHKYVLSGFESEKGDQQIQFIEKVKRSEFNPNTGKNPDELVTVNDGTTNEEVLEMLINRLTYLNSKFPCRENAIAITNLETALLFLEKRTKDRIKRNIEGQAKI